MPLLDCDIWSVVDFGKGPVEVRCTEVGEHDQHRCEVFIYADSEEDLTPNEIDVTHRNIFDDRQAS